MTRRPRSPPSYQDGEHSSTCRCSNCNNNLPKTTVTEIHINTDFCLPTSRRTHWLLLSVILLLTALIVLIPPPRCNHRQRPLEQKQMHLAERDKWKRGEMARAEIRREWQREVEEHDRQMERHKQEEDELRRLGLSWSGLKGKKQCLSYGTREYTAQLENIPAGYNRIKACMTTPVVIHGTTFESPSRCEDDGQGRIYGHWLVNHNEASCSTYWRSFKDKGCVVQGSRKQRIEARLENLQGGDDWREMCGTTPANFAGLNFSPPDYCTNWGSFGTWGIWEIDESNC